MGEIDHPSDIEKRTGQHGQTEEWIDENEVRLACRYDSFHPEAFSLFGTSLNVVAWVLSIWSAEISFSTFK